MRRTLSKMSQGAVLDQPHSMGPVREDQERGGP